MNDLAVKVEDLSKQYLIGETVMHNTLRDTLAGLVKAPFKNLRNNNKKVFWALKDISFQVNHGEILGIIGHNGAGKSTLLKILSRITEPTKGRADIYGRVGSLLEVGTGFHSELTGRENIFLSGAVLGMKRYEIKKKFDEIVEFAEIEEFLETPVKRYSSGMHVRLAFAVAAHLEPEILIIDEVLAVGDSAFQKKCLGKMGEVTQQGRTVLFVSHNMIAVQSLCSRLIWLDKGRIKIEGKPSQIVSEYLQESISSYTERTWEDTSKAPGNEIIRLKSASAHPLNGEMNDPITVQTPFEITFEYWNLINDSCYNFYFQLLNEQGIAVLETGPTKEPVWNPIKTGLFRDTCKIPGNLLNDGVHRVMLQIINSQGILIHQEDDILVFNVFDTTDLREGWYGKWVGTVRPILEWKRDHIKRIEHPK